MSSNPKPIRKGFLLLSLLASLMALAVGLVLWDKVHTQSIQSLQARINDWRPILIGFRWLLISGLALGWRPLVQWLDYAGLMSGEKARQVQNYRWRIIGWLVVIEIVLGQALLAKLLAFTQGSTG